jgi:hypothetical protein
VARSLVRPVSDAEHRVLRKRIDPVGVRGLLNEIKYLGGIR